MTDPKRQSGEQELLNQMDAIVHALGIEDSHVTPVEKIAEFADTIQALQERCGELEQVAADYARTRLSDLERIAALEGTLKAADKALQAMWKAHDRGEHGGSPGEWIVETMDQVATTLAPGGDGGEGQSVEERQGRSFHPKCPCVFHVVGQTIAPECPVHGQPRPTEPDRPEGE